MTITKATAIKDLLIEEIYALKYSKDAVFEFFMIRNLPQQVIHHITKLWDFTYKIGESVVSIGKIILLKIIDFIKENPNMAFGVALGAIAGAMVSSFISWIPFIGQALSAITIGAGMLIGAIAGDRMDRAENGEYIDESLMSVFGDTISVAKKFIKLFIEIITTIKNN
jgi:hypothetical protein